MYQEGARALYPNEPRMFSDLQIPTEPEPTVGEHDVDLSANKQFERPDEVMSADSAA